jgi:hypothetical protein
MSKPQATKDRARDISNTAPRAPKCFDTRHAWVSYLAAAQETKVVAFRPLDEEGSYRPYFNFCRDCGKDWKAQMTAAKRCEPDAYKAALIPQPTQIEPIPMDLRNINIRLIRIDGGTQSRTSLNEAVVAEYADALKDGIELPPVVLFSDGADFWLADGFHRFHAFRAAERASIPADVRNGTQRDAILFAVGANQAHGLRRTNEDKRKSVLVMLEDSEWKTWSDRNIAKQCGVTQPFVSAIRKPRVITVITHDDNVASGVGSVITPEPRPEVEFVAALQQQEPDIHPGARSADDLKEAFDTDVYGELDLVADLEVAHKEIVSLQELVSVAQADDQKAETIKWRKLYEAAVRAQSEALDRVKEAVDREAWAVKQLRRCGKAVGQDDPTKIAAAVELFVRNERAAA